MRAVVLDSGPLGLLTNPRASAANYECNQWSERLLDQGVRIVVPEIADYEVRRELLRLNRLQGIRRLDEFNAGVFYLPITTSVMRQAAVLWAAARTIGQPTAGDKTIDADMILVAQAMSLNLAQTTIATTNVKHLGRFCSAEFWKDITA